MTDRLLAIPLPITEIAAPCRRYRVRELALFGSALRGDFRPDSDLDFLVLFQPGAEIGFTEFTGLQFELEALLGHGVDLVPKGGLKPVIRDEVLASAQVVYAVD